MLFHHRRKTAHTAHPCESLERRLLLAGTPSPDVPPAPEPGTGLRATYYPERFFTGTPVVVSPENAANTFGGGDLLTGAGGPGGVPGLGADPANPDPNETFSGVFEGYLQPEVSGDYEFLVNSDDGIDLKIVDPDSGSVWVNGPRGEINTIRQMEGGFVNVAGSAYLIAGKRYVFVGRFSENTGAAGYRFGWSSASIPAQVIPNDVLFPPEEGAPALRPADVQTDALCNEKVIVSFTDLNATETGYEIQRGASQAGLFATVGTTPASLSGSTVSFDDVASPTNVLEPDATYYYRVRATSPAGDGPFSVPVAARTLTSPHAYDTHGVFNGDATGIFVPWDVDQNAHAVRLTDNTGGQTGGMFISPGLPVDLDFNTQFTFRIPEATTPPADGFVFLLQSDTPRALGDGGGGLGFAGMPNSLGIKFDTYAPGGAINQTGVYVNGAMDDAGSDLGLDLANGHVYKASITYDADAFGDDDALTLRVEDTTDRTVTPFEQTFTTDAAGQPFDMDQVVVGGCAFVGFTGATGGANQEQQILDWYFNGENMDRLIVERGPEVTQVFVNGPGLTGGTPNANQQRFRTLASIDTAYGYAVPAGVNQLKYVPWIGGINQVAIRFDVWVADGTINKEDLVIRGVNTPSYSPSAFHYDPGTRTAVWTLPQAITNDKIRLVLDDAGVPGLDGEWSDGADTYPSGDGRGGGDFNFRINILGGDATQDGRVNALDLSFIKQRQNRSATNPGSSGALYSPFADIDASGTINALDLSAAKARITHGPPPGEPPAATALLFGSQRISA